MVVQQTLNLLMLVRFQLPEPLYTPEAHVAEHLLDKREVVGPIPTRRTKYGPIV